jgi:hypothetical protein
LSFSSGRQGKRKAPAGLGDVTWGKAIKPVSPLLFHKVRPNPRQSVSLELQPAGLLTSPPARRPSHCPEATVADPMPNGFPASDCGQGGVTAAGPFPIFTGFPIIARQKVACIGDRLRKVYLLFRCYITSLLLQFHVLLRPSHNAHFIQFLHQAQILIIEIRRVFPWLKIIAFLKLERN